MIYLAYSLLAFWALWVLFLATMNLKQSQDSGTLHGFALYAGYTVLGVGLLVDFLVQIGPATWLWLELPKELTVSERVARLCREGHGYRQALALWFRNTLLAQFDRSGGHGISSK